MKITYKNAAISYTDSGKGNALVLLHGFLENKNMWHAFIPVLAKRNRVIAIDLLGHGNSDSIGYIHTMEEMAECVHFIISKLKIRKTTIVGHSMGGYVGLAFAENYPTMIRKLMLLNSSAKEDDPIRKMNRDRTIKAVQTNRETFVQIAIPNLFSAKNRTIFQKEINQVISDALATPLQGIIAAIQGMKIRKDRSFIIKNNLIPISIVIGINDPILNYPAFCQEKFPSNTTIHTLQGGHMSHIENEIEVLQILKNFSKN